MNRSGPTGDLQDGSDLFLLTCLGSHHEASTTGVYKSWYAIGHRTAVSHTTWLPLTGPPGRQPCLGDRRALMFCCHQTRGFEGGASPGLAR